MMHVMMVKMMMRTWGTICLLMKTWIYRQSELTDYHIASKKWCIPLNNVDSKFVYFLLIIVINYTT